MYYLFVFVVRLRRSLPAANQPTKSWLTYESYRNSMSFLLLFGSEAASVIVLLKSEICHYFVRSGPFLSATSKYLIAILKIVLEPFWDLSRSQSITWVGKRIFTFFLRLQLNNVSLLRNLIFFSSETFQLR